MRTSYSALETYKSCPQKYKFQEIDKIKAPKSKEALFGSAVHDALQYMFARDPLFPTLDEVLARFREKIMSSKIQDTDKERYAALGLKMLENFYKKNQPWNFNVINLESHFEVVVEDSLYNKAHVLAGKIDRIDKPDDDTIEVIDYKTSKKLPSQNDVDNDNQLTLYNLAILKKWPHINPENIKLSLYFLKAQEKITTSRTEEALKKAESRLLDSIHQIEEKTEKNDFSPTPSALCDWCGYKNICPAWKHLFLKNEQKLDESNINNAVDEFIGLKNEIANKEARVKELANILNNYLDSQKLERLFGKNAIVARSRQERTAWDLKKAEEILRPLGLWDKLLVPNEKKLKKILEEMPREVREKLIHEASKIKTFNVLKISKNDSKS